jgi:chromosome segregation protein
MHGFKSFAEPVTIDFNEGITCIVGPNGSGKSNISDAIRWVLGEQSPKTLRGGKMEDVIFSGTASRKSRGMAEVTLVIDNKTGILPIDFSEVAITRRMYRSGESEYSINNSHCRLRDIRELIMDTGIGVDGYSIIGQGKIADIVSNKSESRREIFEEAAGIVKYRSKKAESERKLEASNVNLERVNDIVSEIEGRIGNLKEESVKAREYIGLRETFKDLEINITLKNIENIELKNEYMKDEISETSVNIDEIKEEKKSLDKEVHLGRERNEELERLNNEARDKLLVSIEQINSLVNQAQLNNEKLTTMGKDNERLEGEIDVINQKLLKEKSNLESLKVTKDEIDKKLTAFEIVLSEGIKKYADMTEKLSRDAEEIDEKKNNIYQLHSSVSTKTAEKNSLISLKATLDRRKEIVSFEKNEFEMSNKETLLNYDSAKEEKRIIEEKFQANKSEIMEIKGRYNQSNLREKQLATELESIKFNIGQLSSRKKTIEEMEANYEGYNGAVKFIMKSNLKGIHGVVGELIDVPSGFETAIETALGASLQNMICEDDNSAQSGILSLKENKAGRLTFLPITSIRGNGGFRDELIKKSNGFKGFGVDCISFNSKYKNIMEYLLGRVVIIDNLANAIKLSKNVQASIRFVTLEGEIINSGGAITGGAFKNKTANLLERKAEILKLGEDIDISILKKEEILKTIEKLRRSIEKDLLSIQSLDLSIRELELNLVSKDNEILSLEKILSGLTSNQEKWLRELNSIEEEKAGANKLISEIDKNVEDIKVEVKETEDKIEQFIAGYEDEKRKLEIFNEEIVKSRIEVNSCESEGNNLEVIVNRIKSTVDELSYEKSIKDSALSGLEKEKENLMSGHLNVEDIVSAKEKEKNNLEKFIEEITEEKGELNSSISEKMLRKDGIEEKLNTLQTQKYEFEIKLAKNETQLEGYKDKLWEEFEVSYIKAIEFKKKEFNMNVGVKESREIKCRMKELGEVNIGSIKEYDAVSERYEFLTVQRADILEAVDGLKKIIEDMDKIIRARFKESFDKVIENFEFVFQEMFGGGHAQLILEDETKPLESGIEIIAQPPGKKLQNLNLLSGGEKTMTAIALMFAVLKAKPTPFCILDEVEAALDDSNIDRFAKYLKNFSNVQFALVTHQKATMEHADVLYGVTMPEQGISKVISLKLGDKIDL